MLPASTISPNQHCLQDLPCWADLFHQRSGELPSEEDSRPGERKVVGRVLTLSWKQVPLLVDPGNGTTHVMAPTFLGQHRGNFRNCFTQLPTPPDNGEHKPCVSSGPSQLLPWLLLQAAPVLPGFSQGLHVSFFAAESKRSRATMHSAPPFFITHLDHHTTFLQSWPSRLGRTSKAKASRKN